MTLKEFLNGWSQIFGEDTEDVFIEKVSSTKIQISGFFPDRSLIISKNSKNQACFTTLDGEVRVLEDLVDLLIYRYQLRLILPPSEYFTELYEVYELDLHDQKPDLTKEVVDLLVRHSEHPFGTKDKETWGLIVTRFPEAIITSKVYRAVNVKEGALKEDLLYEAGVSWSKSKNGVQAFLNTFTNLQEGYYLVEAVIEGLDLVMVYELLKDHFQGPPGWIVQEEEVIGLKVKSIVSSEYFKTE